MLPEFVTLGVYGCTETAFFQTLQAAKVDTFCDLRRRRGVRGAGYAFANAVRLEARLTELGIRYLHRLDLAPSVALRQQQANVDAASHVAKRQRATLSPLFVAAYEQECLAHFDSLAFVASLGSEAKVVALFCVEQAAAACHRSLVAARLEEELGVHVLDLTCAR